MPLGFPIWAGAPHTARARGSTIKHVGWRDLKLFDTTNGVTEVTPWLAEAEADVQALIEGAMEPMLGVRFLATEYSTGPVHGGRIDSLGLDENGSPVIVEYKRATDPGVLSELQRSRRVRGSRC